MNLSALAAPFPPTDIEWRIGQAGKKGDKVWAKVLAYVTNRAIMQRLDDVCHPENWRNEFRYEQGGAILCGLSIRVPPSQGGEWITKWDGAEATDIEAVKGGLSNAMKRAGVQWGIGRYLYDLEEGWAVVSESGLHYVGANEKKGLPAFRWSPPQLPKWALPESEPEKPKRVFLSAKQKGKVYEKAGDNYAAVHLAVTEVTGKPCTMDEWPAITAEEYEAIVAAVGTP